MNKILCGLPRCGKSTIGKRLAEQLNWNFIDTDRLIECRYNNLYGNPLSCSEICRQKGEKLFREIEKEQVKTLKGEINSVIAIGGGSLIDLENLEFLQQIGKLIYLKISEKIIWNRIQLSKIPSYLDQSKAEQSFHEMVTKRLPIYENVAHVIIDINDLKEQEIINEILKHETISNGQ